MNNEPPYAYAVLSFWEQQPDRPVCMPRTGSRSGRRAGQRQGWRFLVTQTTQVKHPGLTGQEAKHRRV